MRVSGRSRDGASRPRAGLALAAALALGACGFEPLYAPKGPAAAAAGRVEVGVIDGSAGFAMRQRLVDRLGPPAGPTHRLEVDLGFERAGVAITERDVTSRFDVIGRADWRLTAAGAERPALAGAERAVTGYSAPTSETSSAFAILSAQRDAEERLALLLADRVARRVAVEADAWAAAR
jgi:LPS-assembly lipoprotein